MSLFDFSWPITYTGHCGGDILYCYLEVPYFHHSHIVKRLFL